jgi:hypothetical protein
MKLLDKGEKYECCRHWSSESQKNFQSPSTITKDIKIQTTIKKETHTISKLICEYCKGHKNPNNY